MKKMKKNEKKEKEKNEKKKEKKMKGKKWKREKNGKEKMIEVNRRWIVVYVNEILTNFKGFYYSVFNGAKAC